MADSKFGKNGWKVRLVSMLTMLVAVVILGGAIVAGFVYVMPKIEAYQKEQEAENEKQLAKEAAAAKKQLKEKGSGTAEGTNSQEAVGNEEANSQQKAAIEEANVQEVVTDTEANDQENTVVEGTKNQETAQAEFPETITEEATFTEPLSDYVIPDSNSRYLSEADVQAMSIQQINYAKNEIYARHGRIFTSKELKNYFESKPWYHGTIDGATFDKNYKNYFNDYEIANAELLSRIEFSMEEGGYKLDQ